MIANQLSSMKNIGDGDPETANLTNVPLQNLEHVLPCTLRLSMLRARVSASLGGGSRQHSFHFVFRAQNFSIMSRKVSIHFIWKARVSYESYVQAQKVIVQSQYIPAVTQDPNFLQVEAPPCRPLRLTNIFCRRQYHFCPLQRLDIKIAYVVGATVERNEHLKIQIHNHILFV